MKKFFNSLSISYKLAVVFLFLLFVMGTGGLVGLYNANQLAGVSKRLYTDSFKRGETLSSVENEFLSARQEVFLHAIISDEASKSYLESSIAEHQKKIGKLLGEYWAMGVSSGHVQEYNDLQDSLSRYWGVHDRIEALSRKGDRDQALSLIRMEGNKSFIDSVNALRKLIKDEKDTAFESYQKSDFFASIIIIVTLIFTLLAIVLVAGLWLALTRAIVRPILAIEESARKIGEGDLKERVPVMTEDEIGSLATAFNKMAGSIEDYYATLEKKVSERTDELKHANEELSGKKHELEQANIGLQEANRMKSQFLANVSHELRTPLNSIIGFSELLQEKAFGDLNERQLQYVEFVHSSGAHLLQLINNILDLSKIEAGRMEINYEDFSVMEVLGEVMGLIRPLAHKRNIDIGSKTVPASPKLHADKAKFKQIMMNLLSNAVKFNVDGGRISVDWDISEEASGMNMERYVTFRIKDSGIGIKEEDKARLFKEFEQIDSSVTREYGGTGLGLVLTKRLVELHGGSIWVDSEPGKGSTFSVRIPQGTDEIDMPVYTSRVYAPARPEKLPLVLIASESPDINHLLEIYLSGGAYDVTTASDGFDLVRKAVERRPFAIIMGVSIPKKDGWEALKELKADPATLDVPVIIISSADNKDLGYALGAFEYMEKPINRERLLVVLERLSAMEREKKGVRNILISDASGDSLEEIASFLEKEGFAVFRARPGTETVEGMRKGPMDAVVIKLGPDASEWDMDSIKLLNEQSSASKTPVIVFASRKIRGKVKEMFGDGTRVLQYTGASFNETLLEEIKTARAV